MDEDCEYEPRNREKALRFKPRPSYCGCDKAVINDGERCPVCKTVSRVNNGKKRRRPPRDFRLD